MSYQFLNGYGSPRILVQNIVTLVNDFTIDLDLCMLEGGLLESYNEDFKRVKLETGRIIDYDFKGSNIKFDLDYNFCTAANLLKIDRICYYNSLPGTYKLYLQPRFYRSQNRIFEVRFSGDEWSQGMNTGGVNSVGHRDVKISFITTYPVGKSFNYTDDSIQAAAFKVAIII